MKFVFFILCVLMALVTALPAPQSSSRRSCNSRRASSEPKKTTDAPAPPAPPATPPPPKDKPDTQPKPSGQVVVSALFPKGPGGKSWSTLSSADNSRPLSDATFRPKKVMKNLPYSYGSAPDGRKAIKVTYPKGSFAFRSNPLGGASFYAPGPKDVDLTKAKEVTFGYSVFFDKGFSFNRGGKLPGLYGGNSEEQAVGCSGGRRDDGCMSARLMWREKGQGELYTYLPPSFSANKNVCKVKPSSDCNADYGASVGRGSFSWKTGAWTTVSQRVRLNDVGKTNGELELFVNGKSVIKAKGLVLRNSDSGRLRGIQFQSFFGGHDAGWASPKTQNAYFADFSVAITENL